MIICDDRTGSKEFIRILRGLGAECCVCRLDAADFAFEGNGPDGPVMIGVERKTISEIAGYLRSKDGDRFVSEQLRPLCRNYDVRYLVIEGFYAAGKESGILESKQIHHSTRPVLYKEFVAYRTTIEEQGDVTVERSCTEYETACIIAAKQGWWSKEWDAHTALGALYTPVPCNPKSKLFSEEPSLVVKVAAQLPGIDKKAWRVGEHFQSVYQMAAAGANDWVEIEGIGRTGARKIVAAIQGEL